MDERVLGSRYRIVRHLARGGMAEVYLAHDDLLDRSVAVKVLFPELADDASFVERFRREARAAAGLNHHNIVSVYDFGEDDGAYFIVMEYVEGQTLRDIIRSDGPMAPPKAAEVGADVAAALAAAHRQGIVHRDVKPGNVLISDVVKVADFGIARAGDPRESLTQTGTVMGTATYLSPEQAQGHDIDARSDIYSLGVVLYEMLAGRPPFSAANPMAIAYQHLSETPVPPSEHNPDVPPGLDAVVLKALSKDPGRRHASAQELQSELLAAGRDGAEPEATVVAPAMETPGATSTVVMPGAVTGADLPPERTTVGGVAPPPRTFRRRQLATIGLLLLMILGAVILIAVLRSGESGTAGVPSVVGQSVGDAERSVEEAGFRATVSERPDQPGDPTRVVDQTPPAGTNARKGTTVTLFTPSAITTSTTRTRTTTQAPATTPAPATTEPPATSPPPTAPPPTAPPLTLPTLPGATTPGTTSN